MNRSTNDGVAAVPGCLRAAAPAGVVILGVMPDRSGRVRTADNDTTPIGSWTPPRRTRAATSAWFSVPNGGGCHARNRSCAPSAHHFEIRNRACL
jgi:hypothetical protein